MNTPTSAEILDALERHINVLLYGPPGTGKTYLMQEVARLFRQKHGGIDPSEAIAIDTEEEFDPLTTVDAPTAMVKWVTFHQSYSYEDFIIGLRPDPASDRLINLVPTPGLLLQLAAFARQPGCASLLAIDEINRGNVSRIFGEFITLLEPDKRLGSAGQLTERTVQVTLPYLRPGEVITVDVGSEPVPIVRDFTLPQSLYTLASMNSVDKSVAPLDTALRRRFHVVELAADEDVLAAIWSVPDPDAGAALPGGLEDLSQVRQVALQMLARLNEGIRTFRGSEYCLGQWYLLPLMNDELTLTEALSVLVELWQSSLYPQLAELFEGRAEQLAVTLDLSGAPHGSPVELVEASESFVEVGGLPFIRLRAADQDQEVAFIRHIAGVPEQPQEQPSE